MRSSALARASHPLSSDVQCQYPLAAPRRIIFTTGASLFHSDRNGTYDHTIHYHFATAPTQPVIQPASHTHYFSKIRRPTNTPCGPYPLRHQKYLFQALCSPYHRTLPNSHIPRSIPHTCYSMLRPKSYEGSHSPSINRCGIPNCRAPKLHSPFLPVMHGHSHSVRAPDCQIKPRMLLVSDTVLTMNFLVFTLGFHRV